VAELSHIAVEFLGEMRQIQYDCLGCDPCYAAEVQNSFLHAFPSLANAAANLSCEFGSSKAENWPPILGEYFILDSAAPVAVSTLGSVGLAQTLVNRKPFGLAIVGKTETENIGLDKIIKNTITNPAIRFLLIAGEEVDGHFAGQTLLALLDDGVDSHGRIKGAKGKHPVLRNVSPEEIESFRAQITAVDMIGCVDAAEIGAKIGELVKTIPEPCGCGQCGCESTVEIASTPAILVQKSEGVVRMDKAGYFVIIPLRDKRRINLEHYDYNHTLLRVLEGDSAADIYKAIINNGWVTELSHAAYLGKELAKAELSLDFGFEYLQDGA
jgi:tetrahydromethanopterin S-methyltransferase subunit A